MNDSNIRNKPKAKAGDIAHTIVKAGISAIPLVGGPAAELFSVIIAPPLAQRKDEWIVSIAEGLKALEEKIDGFKIENLRQNETFITTVMYASRAAIRNHQKEKLEALRNAVLNSASPNAPEDNVQLMFLSFVDPLTPLHLKILTFYNDPQWQPQLSEAQAEQKRITEQANLVKTTFPQINEQFEFYSQLIKDLYDRGLLLLAGWFTPSTPEELFSVMGETSITDMGKRFIDFVTSPIESDGKRR